MFNRDKTKEKEISRREAILKLMTLVACTGGLTNVTPKRLFAQVKTMKDLRALLPVKAVKANQFEAKVIKALLFPEPEVYKAEFGRLVDPIIDPFFQCGLNIWGNDCGNLRSCNEHGCNGESCQQLRSCIENKCTGQMRAKTGGGLSASPDMLNPASLDKIKNDPFIQALLKRLNNTSSVELSNQLRYLLRKRK